VRSTPSKKGTAQALAVGMQVEIAGVVGQFQTEE